MNELVRLKTQICRIQFVDRQKLKTRNSRNFRYTYYSNVIFEPETNYYHSFDLESRRNLINFKSSTDIKVNFMDHDLVFNWNLYSELLQHLFMFSPSYPYLLHPRYIFFFIFHLPHKRSFFYKQFWILLQTSQLNLFDASHFDIFFFFSIILFIKISQILLFFCRFIFSSFLINSFFFQLSWLFFFFFEPVPLRITFMAVFPSFCNFSYMFLYFSLTIFCFFFLSSFP